MINRDDALRAATVLYRPLPDDLYGTTRKRDGGGYVVTINSRKPAAKQAETLTHELAHIRLGHLDDNPGTTDRNERQVFALMDAESGHKRYYRAGADLLQQAGLDGVFSRNGRRRWTGIVEQIGKMYLQNNYSETTCTQTAEQAIFYLEIGMAPQAVESWIRQGRIANEW